MLVLCTSTLRLACVLFRHGVRSGDVVHTLLGTENSSVVPACLAAWILGAAVAFGDESMGGTALAHQVEMTRKCY